MNALSSDPLGRATLLAVMGSLLLASPAWAADTGDCVEPTGDFTSTIDNSPDCTSPVGFCTTGELTGGLTADYAFVMETETVDPSNPTYVTFTGHSTITTDLGVIYSDDYGAIDFSGDVPFMTHVQVVSGDGCFENASGSIVATGNVDLATGITVGTYTSEICDADRCFE